jgi:hypothetical protein
MMIAAILLPGIANAQSAPSAGAPPLEPPIVAPMAPMAPTATPVEPTDTGEVVEQGFNGTLFASGAGILAAGYLGGVIAATTGSHHAIDELYIPFAGPWIALNDWGTCPNTQPCTNGGQRFALAADGVVQAIGVIAMVDALLSPRHRHVLATTAVNDKKLHVTSAGNGFALFSHF